jgi:LacI family transcriptional regulator
MASPKKIAAYFDPFSFTRQFEILAGISRYTRSQPTVSLGPHPLRSVHLRASDVQNWTGDGIIGFFYDPELAAFLIQRGIAVVNLTEHLTPTHPSIPAVSSDGQRIGQMAAAHLMERGYRRFGYVGDRGLIYSNQRRDGFLEALRSAGVYQSLLWAADPPDRDEISPTWWTEHCSPSENPIGILAADDELAANVLIAVQALGLRVPQDVAIIGVNDMDLICDAAAIPLTSIAPAYLKIGLEAARLLDNVLHNRPLDKTVVRVPPAGLTARMSTRFLAFNDPLVERALIFMHANINRPYNVQDIVRQIGKSRRTLENRFSRAVGRSVLDEIIRLRLERAKQLLTFTDWTLGRIAEECGFHNTKRLHETLLRIEGRTPKSFREGN